MPYKPNGLFEHSLSHLGRLSLLASRSRYATLVNVECVVEQTLTLDSHTLFIGRVLAVHVEESLLDADRDVDLNLARGLVYGCGTVREKPVGRFRMEDLRRQAARSGSGWAR